MVERGTVALTRMVHWNLACLGGRQTLEHDGIAPVAIHVLRVGAAIVAIDTRVIHLGFPDT